MLAAPRADEGKPAAGGQGLADCRDFFTQSKDKLDACAEGLEDISLEGEDGDDDGAGSAKGRRQCPGSCNSLFQV